MKRATSPCKKAHSLASAEEECQRKFVLQANKDVATIVIPYCGEAATDELRRMCRRLSATVQLPERSGVTLYYLMPSRRSITI